MPRTDAGEAQEVEAGGIEAVYRLGLRPGDLLLESIEDFAARHGIRDGAVLTGIGSLSECRIHWPARPEFPPEDEFATFRGALEIAAIQGIIADGEPHLHLIVVEGGDRRAVGGHMEKGCKVLYLAEITIAKFRGPPMTRRASEHGVKMLGPR
jgi:predicted DNA-binding protein with PD1-like motif